MSVLAEPETSLSRARQILVLIEEATLLSKAIKKDTSGEVKEVATELNRILFFEAMTESERLIRILEQRALANSNKSE